MNLPIFYKSQVKDAVSSDIDLKASGDSSTSMLIDGILRFSDIPTILDSSHEYYMKTCVNLFVDGITR
ncbi:hypothetical protein GTQ43_07520 [Nostoc sp. KVJ3]|uniref:hypothetical protein n=1 Tax=Nostoc sp. KVJ3 TaxID=457945 RepID=UPI002237251B|nr:hypothetical protein [Nostoc sp. KVJ3]MCW5313658.1 hypothetical protein [Nostoc sp. KVJ3]